MDVPTQEQEVAAMAPVTGRHCYYLTAKCPGVPLLTKDALAQQAGLILRTGAGNGSQVFSGNAEGKAFPGSDCWHMPKAAAAVKSRDVVNEMSCSVSVPSLGDAPSENKFSSSGFWLTVQISDFLVHRGPGQGP